MGLKEMFGIGKNKGVQCTTNQDGTKTCVRFQIKDGNKVATGSELTLATDPQTCKVHPVGTLSLNDEELEDFNNMAKMMESECRRGVQSQ